MDDQKPQSVAIVGGGLVGSLAACIFAKRGWSVSVYEMRHDPRVRTVVHGRSINLAASCRARDALRYVGLEGIILENGIPMPQRYIHNLDGKTGFAFPYGKSGQFILSVNRRLLNELMLSEAEKHDNVKVFFRHKMLHLDLDSDSPNLEITGLDTENTFTVTVDLIVAADGAYSNIRRTLMTRTLLDYSQEYIRHGYLEFVMPATANNEYKIPPNNFHLWPRGQYCLIALANMDRTYTVTLFAPFETFDRLKTRDEIIKFFDQSFPDALEMIGQPEILHRFLTVAPGAMVSVKCSPHHYKDKIVLLGDAAHAMVPFYGQGMNSGFEDCLVLKDLLDKHNDNIELSLEEYSETRPKDAHAICDLAIYNYKELCYLVNDSKFRFRKKVDNFLNSVFPRSWVPMYSMVTFTRTRYHKVIEHREWQDKVLRRLKWFGILVGFGGTFSLVLIFRPFSVHNNIFK